MNFWHFGLSLGLLVAQAQTTNAPATSSNLTTTPPASMPPEAVCTPLPITSYTAQPGDTLDRLARANNLSRETILGANPVLQKRTVRPGDVLVLLPRDGILYRPRPGEGFVEVAARFRVRGDVLFEINGCALREQLFIPGVRWTPPPAKPKPATPPPQQPAQIKLVPAPPVIRTLPPPPKIPDLRPPKSVRPKAEATPKLPPL